MSQVELVHSNEGAAQDTHRATLFASLASAVTLVGAAVRSKVTALYLGPIGLGISSEVMQLVAVVMIPLGLVAGPALVKNLATTQDTTTRQRVYDVSGSLLFLVGIGLTAVCSIAGSVLFHYDTLITGLMFSGLGALGLVLTTLVGLPNQVLMASQKSRQFSLFLAVTGAINTVVVCTGTWRLGLMGQFLAGVIGPLTVGVVLWPAYQKALPQLRLRPSLRLDRSFTVEAITLGTSSLVAAFAAQTALSVVRLSLDSWGGPGANGQFQAAFQVASSYFNVLLSGLGTVYIPLFAAALDSTKLASEVQQATRLIMRNAPPLILLAIAVRHPAFQLLYSRQFDVAPDVAGFQMAGDLARAVSWAHAAPLLYRGHIRLFMITEFAAAGLLAALSYCLIPLFGVRGAAYAYTLNYVIYVILCSVVLYRGCGVPLQWGPLVGAVTFALFGGLAAEFTRTSVSARMLLGVVAVLWSIATGQFSSFVRFALERWRRVSRVSS